MPASSATPEGAGAVAASPAPSGTVRDLRVAPAPPSMEASCVTCRFGHKLALDEVSVAVAPGEIHALLGANGAGKTTLLRTFTGLLGPSAGTVRVMGLDPSQGERSARALTGFVPSGDRTFYLRLSGLENLRFFARLHGMSRREARTSALRALAQVDLAGSARLAVSAYSHGMQKRLSLARALLTKPPAMLVDEATHDLDPEAAAGVRALVEGLAGTGTAVLWATQRIDEIRGFATCVTVLGEGRVRFAGSVGELVALARARRFVLRASPNSGPAEERRMTVALNGAATIDLVDEAHWLLSLERDTELGEAISILSTAGLQVLDCYRERSEIEDAFVALAGRARQ
jgi:ABC-type multidrug transport system ATPase subunit